MKRAILALLGLFSILLLSWLLFGGGSSSDLESALPEGGRALEATSDKLVAATGKGEGTNSPGSSVPVEVGAERRDLLDESFDLERATWIEGRVLLPTATPKDEVAYVIATRTRDEASALGLGEEEREDAPQPISRAAVDQEGGFRLPLPEGLDSVHLSVHGRYVYSLRSRELPNLAESDIELEVTLGAWIVGTLTCPKGASLAGLEARLAVDPEDSTNVFDGSAWQLRTTLAAGGAFEFAGVATENPLRVFALSDQLAAATSEKLELQPGERHELHLISQAGGTVRGRVLDSEGEGFAGAEVFVLDDANFMAGRPGRRIREVVADEEGRFELPGVAAGSLSVRAHLDGYLQVSRRIELASGQTVEGVELVLTRGRRIRGRVLSRDGTPREGAELVALFDLGSIGGMEGIYAIRGNYQETTSDAEGRFELSGLGRGPFTVTASWVPDEWRDESAGDSDLAALTHTARVEKVQPGVNELELRLEEPIAIAGVVFDSEGLPASEFHVRAERSSESLIASFGTEVIQRSFESEEGEFQLWGLREGPWSVIVVAPEHAPSEALEVHLPRATEDEALEIYLGPELSVSGQVLFPDGTRAKGAKVGDSSHALERMSKVFHSVAEDNSISDAQGSFRIGGLREGRLSLVATLEGYAESTTVEVDLKPGVPIEDLVLRLRSGARVTGEVYDDQGGPAVGDAVIAQIPGSLDMLQTSSDPEGRFVFEDMIPGKWQIVALPNEDQVAELIDEADGGVGRLLTGMRIQVVDLEEGDEKHVLLGEPLPDPVKVFGRITIDEKAVPGVVVSFISRGGHDASVRFGSADAAGHYELALPSAGPYVMLVQRMGQVMAETSLEYRVEIPEVEEYEYDVAIPLGVISGQVFGPDGEVLANARVSLVGQGNGEQTFWGGQFTETSTSAEGRYEIEWLRGGKYLVTAGGLQFGGLLGEPSPWGRGEGREVSVGDGEHQDGVDFRLVRGGKIRGVVRDDLGIPVPDAAIYVYDERGQPVERLSFERTDSSGMYEVRSLAPGEYSVLARTETQAGEPSERVLVESEKSSALDVQVVGGTLLEVEVVGPDREPVEADVRVLDADGRNLGGVVSFEEVVQAFQSGSASTLQRVGPLAPGKYTISASVPGVGSAEKRVTLRGREARKIVLRLK